MLGKKAEFILTEAKKQGATQAETSLATEEGYDVTVRSGDVETIEYHHNYAVGITVYFDHKTASVTVSDLNEDKLKEAVDKACVMAKFTESDPCSGLADANRLATRLPNLDQYHPWILSVEEAIDRSKSCEEIALSGRAVEMQSEGVNLSTQSGEYCYANSHGFCDTQKTSRHSMHCSLIAKLNGEMERDDSYTIARDAKDLMAIDLLAELAASRAASRLGARKMETNRLPVIFAAPISRSIARHLLAALNGHSIYRNASFLKESLGQQICSSAVNLFERPYLPKGLGSDAYDNEGVQTSDQSFVKEGRLEKFILNSYSARQLGMETTGNEGGVHNGFMIAGDLSFSELLQQMDRGVLVTELIGQGVNLVTGDYSRGAFGYWVENGVVQYPVSGITIAGNLKEMLMNIVNIATDIDRNGNVQIGSILIDGMMIAGS